MKINTFVLLFLLPLIWSCEKLVNVDTPQNQLTADKVYADTAILMGALANTYSLFDRTIDPNFNKYLALYVGELSYSGSNPQAKEFAAASLSTTNGIVLNIWQNFYFAIYQCNDLIEHATLPQIVAEAKFLRAFSYYYLVNSFGNVPLLLTTNVNQNASAFRIDAAVVYLQIIKDLNDAKNTLPEMYPSEGRVRVNKWAAAALLSRIYLEQQNWELAVSNATEIINTGLYTPLEEPFGVFLAGSKESILQFWTQNGFISDAPNLVPSGAGQYSLSRELAASFDPADLRFKFWSKSMTSGPNTLLYPYKYRSTAQTISPAEYLSALRISEQYLIRAEAGIHLKDLPGAIADLNVIRERAGLTDLSNSLSESACYQALEKEWKTEFFAEWGHGFINLKRSGALKKLLPIPQNEITYNKNLTQNTSY